MKRPEVYSVVYPMSPTRIVMEEHLNLLQTLSSPQGLGILSAGSDDDDRVL